MNRLRLAAAAALALAALSAHARDEQLVFDMCVLEKAYIDPLFFTSNQSFPKTAASFPAFKRAWAAFSATYRSYRPDETNWKVHFDAVERAIAEAEAIVVAAQPACSPTPTAPCPQLVPAHDALEAVRLELLELRSHNGYPRFITDKLTAYHGPMEAMVLTVKGLTAAQITDELIAALSESFHEAAFLWDAVERTPIDDAWGFTATQRATIAARIAGERSALDAFGRALATADRANIPALGVALKQAFVPVYTSFAGDPVLNRL